MKSLSHKIWNTHCSKIFLILYDNFEHWTLSFLNIFFGLKRKTIQHTKIDWEKKKKLFSQLFLTYKSKIFTKIMYPNTFQIHPRFKYQVVRIISVCKNTDSAFRYEYRGWKCFRFIWLFLLFFFYASKLANLRTFI